MAGGAPPLPPCCCPAHACAAAAARRQPCVAWHEHHADAPFCLRRSARLQVTPRFTLHAAPVPPASRSWLPARLVRRYSHGGYNGSPAARKGRFGGNTFSAHHAFVSAAAAAALAVGGTVDDRHADTASMSASEPASTRGGGGSTRAERQRAIAASPHALGEMIKASAVGAENKPRAWLQAMAAALAAEEEAAPRISLGSKSVPMSSAALQVRASVGLCPSAWRSSRACAACGVVALRAAPLPQPATHPLCVTHRLRPAERPCRSAPAQAQPLPWPARLLHALSPALHPPPIAAQHSVRDRLRDEEGFAFLNGAYEEASTLAREHGWASAALVGAVGHLASAATEARARLAEGRTCALSSPCPPNSAHACCFRGLCPWGAQRMGVPPCVHADLLRAACMQASCALHACWLPARPGRARALPCSVSLRANRRRGAADRSPQCRPTAMRPLCTPDSPAVFPDRRRWELERMAAQCERRRGAREGVGALLREMGGRPKYTAKVKTLSDASA